MERVKGIEPSCRGIYLRGATVGIGHEIAQFLRKNSQFHRLLKHYSPLPFRCS